MTDPYATITDVSRLIRERALSPVTLVERSLERIDALGARFNTFITVMADSARAAAHAAETDIASGGWRGPLHGVPVAVKDFYDTAGVKTTAAFDKFANRVPGKDAAVVTALKRAGAIVIGKTNMDSLGMGTTGLASAYGPVKNPWNAEYIPGGSSSGSAVAVATGMCFATIDTDAIGSSRLPASCCGVVGLKGTYGRINTEGILAGETPPDEVILWLGHAGITTRSAADTAIVFSALAEPVSLSSNRFRLGVASNIKPDADIAAAFESAVETLRSLGHEVKSAAVPFADPSRGIKTIERARASAAREAFADVDLLILPTIPNAVPTVLSAEGTPQALTAAHTAFANYYGVPAITVPCGVDAQGLPVGLQIVGKPSSDVDVLSLAQQYEDATPWKARHPAV